MKYQCESCDRLVKVETYVLEDHALAVGCPACGAWTRAAPSISKPASPRPPPEGDGLEEVAVAAPYAGPLPPPPSRPSVTALRVVRPDAPAAAPLTLDEDPFQAPPGRCPKCVAPMREDDGACSACGLVYANFIPEEHQPSEVLAREWRELMAAWHDPDAHDRVLTQAMLRGEMAMVGRLYRMRLARAPNDAQALRGRDEVVRRVTTATALTSDGPSPELGRRVKSVVMGTVLVVSLVLLLVLFHMMRGSF
ncbi:MULTISPECIES: hypothetical protein [unclassified Corallococcus]|uniref:hypothetical protein n=1 Tax=unclassified Corallococcus TaxID=2685029 RepID=UPI001A908A44|nr:MULTISPECIES: hypothetical protein [unclassified Corallococcus]MBN9682200.1 hypothetical protein [Corallococcus sp. NCSPR001]WAS86239.1 hypothetical protein O0N60_04530 [Corallococcus sp. NCRR]